MTIRQNASLWQPHDRAARPGRRRFLLASLLTVAILLLPMRSAANASTVLGAPTAPGSVLTAPLSPGMELRLSFRLLFAGMVGAAVGKERSHHHPAGVRTMSLVSLGAAAFTICSMYGFAGCRYDPSRMASNVASGVGFVGAGVITTTRNKGNESVVHGLTTAAAIWLSAAMGVASGLGLFYIASVSALATIGILRVNQVAEKIQPMVKRVELEEGTPVVRRKVRKVIQVGAQRSEPMVEPLVNPNIVVKRRKAEKPPDEDVVECEDDDDDVEVVRPKLPLMYRDGGWNETSMRP